MGGRNADSSKVIRAPHDPAAKMPLPDAVHHDPRCQHVVARGDPIGECGPPAGGLPIGHRCWYLRFLRLEEARKYRFHFRSRIARHAAAENEDVGHNRPHLFHTERPLNRQVFLQLFQLRQGLFVAVGFFYSQNLVAVPFEQPDDINLLCWLDLVDGERAAFEVRPRPGDGKALHSGWALEIVDANRRAARLQRQLGGFLAPFAVKAVVFNHRLTIDGEPGAVVGIEVKRVLAVSRHLERTGKHETEREFATRQRNVEEAGLNLALIFGLEIVKVREFFPGIAVERILELVDVASC